MSTPEDQVSTQDTPDTPSTVLVLRTCKADLTSPSPDAKGFKWPEAGPVEAPDFEPTKLCGHGLHGALWGEGDGNLFCWDADAKWLVVAVTADSDIIDLDGKVKFRKGTVVYCGDRKGATDYIYAHNTSGRSLSVIGGYPVAGARGTATAGDYGHATAGDHGTATAGDNGHATAGFYGTATAGDNGHATAGDHGHATAGDHGTATAGDNGHATAGFYGTATAGDNGHATAGEGGIIVIRYWDSAKRRCRCLSGDVGKDEALKPGVAYKVVDGKFVQV